MAFQIFGTQEHREWDAILKASRRHDFHHLPAYHRVAEQRGDGAAHLFAYREGDYTIALPLLVRPVDAEKPAGWQDATSVYGYGGPVASHDSIPELVVRNFQTSLTAALAELRVVAVFSRLHPLIAQHHVLAGLGECLATGTTLSIDLTLTEDEQRAGYSKNCRANLRKLREAGFVGLLDSANRYLPEFVDIYRETMRRAGAQESYFFDEAYFNLLTRELGGAARLFVVLKDGEVAAASLCTICGDIVQDHLGGTRSAFLKFSPDRLVVDTEREWAIESGARVFHLGGGVGAQEDSLFRYKTGFSKRRHTYSTFRWVLRPDIYQALEEERRRWNAAHDMEPISPGYFPAYRCPATPRQDPSAAPSNAEGSQIIAHHG